MSESLHIYHLMWELGIFVSHPATPKRSDRNIHAVNLRVFQMYLNSQMLSKHIHNKLNTSLISDKSPSHLYEVHTRAAHFHKFPFGKMFLVMGTL